MSRRTLEPEFNSVSNITLPYTTSDLHFGTAPVKGKAVPNEKFLLMYLQMAGKGEGVTHECPLVKCFRKDDGTIVPYANFIGDDDLFWNIMQDKFAEHLDGEDLLRVDIDELNGEQIAKRIEVSARLARDEEEGSKVPGIHKNGNQIAKLKTLEKNCPKKSTNFAKKR